MSDFWSRALGQVAAPAAPQPAPAAPAGPWWQTRAIPVQQAPQPPAAPVQQERMATGREQHFGDLLSQQGYTTSKAQSAKDNERCPDCGGPNYMRSSQSPNSMKTCFDCGFNPRFLHSTHGIGSTGENIPVRTARGQTMSERPSDFGKIIARVA